MKPVFFSAHCVRAGAGSSGPSHHEWGLWQTRSGPGRNCRVGNEDKLDLKCPLKKQVDTQISPATADLAAGGQVPSRIETQQGGANDLPV